MAAKEPRLGVNHLTVVPTNFRSDRRGRADDGPSADGD